MPPVKPSASATDVDNEATAELPVLDVAAYESTLDEPAHTDTWVLPSMKIDNEAIPTLRTAVDLESTADISMIDFSGTHEMPAMPFKNALKSAKAAHMAASESVAPAPKLSGKAAKRAAHAARHPESVVPAAEVVPQVPAPARDDDPTLIFIAATAATAAATAAPAPVATAPGPAIVAAPPSIPAPAAAVAPPPAKSTPRLSASSAPSAPIVIPPSPPMIEELRNSLATAERRVLELEERARIADAERTAALALANAESTQLRQQLDGHLEALASAREKLAVRKAEDATRDDELFKRTERIKQLESDLGLQNKVLDEKVRALAEALNRAESLQADLVNLRAAVARRDQQIGVLEADLVARQQRESALKARLETALNSVNANVPQLRADIAARDEQVRTLERAIKEAQARIEDRNQDLQVAEESIRNLEIEVRDKTGKLQEASVTVEEWRAVIAESQRSILERDSRIREIQSDLDKRIAAADSASHTSEEVALEGPARVLIRTDGNTDFVHVLGRRTRIGRGADNELVIDTKHISRYHAVLLAGPVHTSIEDLQSTNGVFVNNKRVTRQVLKDGDRVQIGRTQFRYTVRD
jgi:peptidoglycan hydrolase CwlO-like protein